MAKYRDVDANEYTYRTSSESNSRPSPRQSYNPPPRYEQSPRRASRLQQFLSSFQRNPYLNVTPRGAIGSNGRVFDPDCAAAATADTPLARRLKGRHLQMIAIGGSIGTGLFVASGKALSEGGPASLLIGFSLIGVMIYCTVQALGEMAVLFPVAGSFSAYSTRFIDPAWGFAMGWVSRLDCWGGYALTQSVELCPTMARRLAGRSHCGFHHHQLLGHGSEVRSGHLCRRLSSPHHIHQSLWRQRIWGSRVFLLHDESHCHCGLYVSGSMTIWELRTDL